jgi:hypothetical protein
MYPEKSFTAHETDVLPDTDVKKKTMTTLSLKITEFTVKSLENLILIYQIGDQMQYFSSLIECFKGQMGLKFL